LANDPLILAAAELARQEHGEGSHHSIAWEVGMERAMGDASDAVKFKGFKGR